MLENRFHKTVIIRVPNMIYLDGSPQYDEYTGEAFETSASGLELREPAGISANRVFLIRCQAEIVPGSLVVSDGKQYQIGNVKRCRRLNGADFCYRCQTVKSIIKN